MPHTGRTAAIMSRIIMKYFISIFFLSSFFKHFFANFLNTILYFLAFFKKLFGRGIRPFKMFTNTSQIMSNCAGFAFCIKTTASFLTLVWATSQRNVSCGFKRSMPFYCGGRMYTVHWAGST